MSLVPTLSTLRREQRAHGCVSDMDMDVDMGMDMDMGMTHKHAHVHVLAPAHMLTHTGMHPGLAWAWALKLRT